MHCELSGEAAVADASGTNLAGSVPSAVIDDSPDMTTLVDANGIFRYVSTACQRLFGWEVASLCGRSEVDFVHPDDHASLLWAHESLNEVNHATVSFRLLCADGFSRWTETTCRRVSSDGNAFIVSSLRDATTTRARRLSLERQASSDPLTGVVNRAMLIDRLQHGLQRMSRNGGLLAVLYLDLDRFKVVNNLLGHRGGDQVLVEMATRLVHQVRPADTVGRPGGDEFVVLAEDLADEQQAVALADRIVEAGRKPFRVGAEEFVCTVSVGIVCTADPKSDAQQLLDEADMALFRAKDRGRDRAESFDEELRSRVLGRLVKERMLRRALDDKRLVVEYQPIIDLRTGTPVAAEALTRIHDGRGLLFPISFLDVAEETGLLVTMDDLVIMDAVRQARIWRSRLAHTDFAGIAVNITGRHLARSGFAGQIIALLDLHELPHQQFRLELTERVLLDASTATLDALRSLREAGIQIGLDDFGTGYSSLVSLRKLPLDYIKVDLGAVDEQESGADGLSVAEAIVHLAHAVGLTVTAEGVETERQLDFLRRIDCDRAQGFLFAKPGEPEAIDRLMVATPRLV